MSETVFMHDGAVASFSSVEQDGVTVDDSGTAEFTWDEVPIVSVNAPADLQGAFDTERFYKIEGATIARPIKQPYHVGDDVEVYKKPADELRNAAWSFDNSPFTLDHPETGMVKDVNDVHGFWKNPRYLDDEDRLNADLYIPETDDEALEFVENNQDVSVGFFNRVYRDYDGDTGDISDDDVDGFQVDIFGNHVAGVKRGRCSSEQGCGLTGDDASHGRAVLTTSNDNTTSFLTEEDQTEHEDDDSDVTRIPRRSTDQPSGIKSHEDEWYAVGPNEHTKDSTDHPGDHMYPVGGCSNVNDAWNLRGSAEDLEIDQDTLAQRIIRAAEAQDCDSVPSTLEERMDDSNTDSNTTMDDNFDIPDLSIDALAKQNDQVQELQNERDAYRSTVEELREELDLAEDECPCDVVPDLKAERDDKAETLSNVADALDIDEETDVASRAESIAEEWQEFRADKRDERLDELESLGADRDEYEDEPIDAIEAEIDRRKEVLEEVDDTSPTGIDTDSGTDEDGTTNTSGTRTFGRGHKAAPDAS
jgi:hypothetical protein